MISRRIAIGLACVLFAGLFVSSALGSVIPRVHHFAETLAEADYNRETKRLEVALSMSPTDLEWLLSRRAEKDIDLEKTEKVDELITTYLEETFKVDLQDKTRATLSWVGKEVLVKRVWLYFEVALPKGLEGVTISNRILLRWERDQVNRVNLRDGKFRLPLTFTREHPSRVVSKKTKKSA